MRLVLTAELNRIATISDLTQQEFEAVYQGEYRRVLALAIALSGSTSLGEELAQEAFLAAYRRWDQVGKLESPAGWVRRVVSNRAVSVYRRSRSEVRAVARLESRSRQDADLTAALQVWVEVRRLPRRQAQVIALTYMYGMSRREVAATLGCSEETVKTHLAKARKTLEVRLGDDEL